MAMQCRPRNHKQSTILGKPCLDLEFETPSPGQQLCLPPWAVLTCLWSGHDLLIACLT